MSLLDTMSFSNKGDAIDYALDNGWTISRTVRTTVARRKDQAKVLQYDKELWYQWKSI